MKSISKATEEINTLKFKFLMYKNMINKLNDYIVQNRRTLTDDEFEELTNDTEQSE